MKTYNIICASYFDPLGHPLFADKVCENIIKLEEDNVRVRIYGIFSDEKESPNDVNIIGVKVPFFGKYYSNKSRKRLIEKFHIHCFLNQLILIGCATTQKQEK